MTLCATTVLQVFRSFWLRLVAADEVVRESEINLGRTVTSLLSTERAFNNDVVAWELLLSRWDVSLAQFALHHKVSGLDRPLHAVMHRHCGRLSEYEEKVIHRRKSLNLQLNYGVMA